MKRVLLALALLLFAAPVAFGDLPRPPRPPASPLPPPPPPPPSAVIAGTAATAGLILGGMWLVRRTRLRPEPRTA
jgi:hypothetical protein